MRLPELSRWGQVAHRHHKNNTSGHHGAEITEQRRGHDGYSKALAQTRDGGAGSYLLCYKPDAELTLQKHRKNKSDVKLTGQSVASGLTLRDRPR